MPRHRSTREGRGIQRDGFEIVGDNPNNLVVFQNFARSSPIFCKKKIGAVCNSREALVRAASHGRLPRPICDRWRKPPWRKKGTHLRRWQVQRQMAHLHRFVPRHDSAGIFHLVRPKSRVPIAQNRKDRYHKSDPNRRARCNWVEQTWKRNREYRDKKICPAYLPNRKEVTRNKQNNNQWRGALAEPTAISLSHSKTNQQWRYRDHVSRPTKPNRI